MQLWNLFNIETKQDPKKPFCQRQSPLWLEWLLSRQAGSTAKRFDLCTFKIFSESESTEKVPVVNTSLRF